MRGRDWVNVKMAIKWCGGADPAGPWPACPALHAPAGCVPLNTDPVSAPRFYKASGPRAWRPGYCASRLAGLERGARLQPHSSQQHMPRQDAVRDVQTAPSSRSQLARAALAPPTMYTGKVVVTPVSRRVRRIGSGGAVGRNTGTRVIKLPRSRSPSL